jgi:hypothetical protein
LRGNTLSTNNKKLLTEIVEIGSKCGELIIHRSGLVDNLYLRQDLLPKAASHFFILREVSNQSFVGEFERFKEYSLTVELDSKLENEVDKLKNRLKVLNA